MSDVTTAILLSKQLSLTHNLDVISNNVSNTGSGFRRLLQVNKAVPMPHSQGQGKVEFTSNYKTQLDLSPGPIEYTENTLDMAIAQNGNAFFTVQTPQGSRYTRNGAFVLDGNYNLILQIGNVSYQVLDTSGKPVAFQQDTTDIYISPDDGTVFANGSALQQLGIVKFVNPDLIEAIGDSLYNSPVTPVPATNFKVIQGALEKSNVSQVKELTNLMNVQRTNDAVNKLMNDQIDLSSKTVTRFIDAAKK